LPNPCAQPELNEANNFAVAQCGRDREDTKRREVAKREDREASRRGVSLRVLRAS